MTFSQELTVLILFFLIRKTKFFLHSWEKFISIHILLKHNFWYLRLSPWLLMPNIWRKRGETGSRSDIEITWYQICLFEKNLIHFKFFSFQPNIGYLYRYTLHLALLLHFDFLIQNAHRMVFQGACWTKYKNKNNKQQNLNKNSLNSTGFEFSSEQIAHVFYTFCFSDEHYLDNIGVLTSMNNGPNTND